MARLESLPHPPLDRDWPSRTDDQIFDEFFKALREGDAEWPPLSWPRICAALIRRVQQLEQRIDRLNVEERI